MATLTIDDDAYAELSRRAEERGMTAEEWLNRTYAKPNHPPLTPPPPGQSLYDAFKAAGVIGCVKGGPTDVATNPKYMEGYGRS